MPAVTAVHPILVVPGRTAPDADAEAVRRAIPAIQAWWEDVGAPLLLLDPKTPACREPWEWFAATPGGAYYGAQAWAVEHGYTQRGCKALVLLQGYPDGHGQAGPSVGVVGYGVIGDLAAGGDAADRACGLVSHEIGHLEGLQHVPTPQDLMNLMGQWAFWPRVGLSVLPALDTTPTPPRPALDAPAN